MGPSQGNSGAEEDRQLAQQLSDMLQHCSADGRVKGCV